MNRKYSIDDVIMLKSIIKNDSFKPSDYYNKDSSKLEILAKENSINLTKITITDLNHIDFDWDNKIEQIIPGLKTTNRDFEFGKSVFEILRDLPPIHAADPGYWTFHNHHTFHKFIYARWPEIPTKDGTYVANHWIQTSSSQSNLIKYPVSGLWWAFFATLNDGSVRTDKSDNYWYTKVLFKNYTLRTVHMGQSKFFCHKPAVFGVLEFIEQYYDNLSVEHSASEIVKYMNLLGGIRAITSFEDKDWFFNKLEDKWGDFIRREKSKGNEKIMLYI